MKTIRFEKSNVYQRSLKFIMSKIKTPPARLLLILIFLLILISPSVAADWPQWLGPQRDAVWRETGIVEKFPADGLKYRWRVPIGGGYAGPAVAGGRVYVTDRQLAKGASNPANPFARDHDVGELDERRSDDLGFDPGRQPGQTAISRAIGELDLVAGERRERR